MQKDIITDFKTGERLDKTLASLYPQYSRSAIEKLIETGEIRVNDGVVKTKYLLKAGDSINLDFTELDRQPVAIDLPIIYEDANVVVIDKPLGILAHSKGTFSPEATVATWLKTHAGVIPTVAEGSSKGAGDLSTDVRDDKAKDFWDSNRAGIVHRLDRATSGVMICAKNEVAQRFLQKQFAIRNVKKTYLAVVSGELPESAGLIDVPIERNPKKPATFRAGINGKTAQTQFSVIKTGHLKNDASPLYSLVELRPTTGRTHQLRVHLSYLKHPIVGDEFYSGEPGERLFLHASSLEITLPGGDHRTFHSPLPASFEVA